nr:indolepyruvate oxidoreductase [Campylobacter sp.]
IQGISLLEKIEQIRKFNYENFIKPKIANLKGGDKAEILCITSGVASSYVSEAVAELKINADVLKIDMSTPLPYNELNELCKSYKKVVVFEEPYACMEEDLSGENIFGKKTGHVHNIHEFGKDKVFDAFKNLGLISGENPFKAPKFSQFELPKRPPNLCPGCPHRDIFYSITKVFRTKQSIYASDIGCYTLALNQNALDHFLCMGASISTASGFALANPDKTVVATIGDSTFLHSGMPPLINAVYQKHKFILIILDNSTTAMTGRQTTPENASNEIDIKKLVEGCGIKCYEYFYEPDLNKTLLFMKNLKTAYENSDLPVVAVIRQFCILDKANSKIPQIYAVVNEAKCVECDNCISKYKCPAMSYNERHKVEIDPFLCTGCSACIGGLCPTDAFEVRSK